MDSYVAFLAGLLAFLQAAFFIHWRSQTLKQLERTQKDKSEELWQRNYLSQYATSVKGRHPYDVSRVRKVFDQHIQSVIDNLQKDYSRHILLEPYVILIVVWAGAAYGIGQATLGTQTNMLSLFLGVSLLPFLLQGFFDLLATRWKTISDLMSGRADNVWMIVYPISFAGVVTLLFLFFDTMMWPLILGPIMLPLATILIIVISALRMIGITARKAMDDFQRSFENACRELADCIHVVVMLKETHETTSGLFSGVYEDLEQDVSMLQDVMTTSEGLLKKGESLLSGEVRSKEERSQIVKELRNLFNYTIVDLKAWWIDIYLKASGDRGCDRDLLRVGYALTDEEYWEWSKGAHHDITSDRATLWKAFRPRITRLHSQRYYSYEIDTLSHIAVIYAQRRVTSGPPSLSEVFRRVETHEHIVMEVFRFLKQAQTLHEDEGKRRFEITGDTSDVAKIVVESSDHEREWRIVSQAYSSLVTAEFSAEIVVACIPRFSNSLPDRFDAIAECLTNGEDSTILQIVYRRLLDRINSSTSNDIVSDITVRCLSGLSPSTGLARAAFEVSRTVIEYLGTFKARMRDRFPSGGTSPPRGLAIANPLASSPSSSERDIIAIMLGLIGESLFESSFESSLIEALLTVEFPDTWSETTPVLEDIIARFSDESKAQLLFQFVIDNLEGLHSSQTSQMSDQVRTLATIIGQVVLRTHPPSSTVLPYAYKTVKRMQASLEWYEKLSNRRWADALNDMSQDTHEQSAFEVVLETEQNVLLLALSYTLLTRSSHDEVVTFALALRETYGEEISTLSLLRFWNAINSVNEAEHDKAEMSASEILRELLLKRTSLNLTDSLHSDAILHEYRDVIIDRFLLCITSLDQIESQLLSALKLSELYDTMSLKGDHIATRLELLRKLVSEGSRVIGYAATMMILPAWHIDHISMDVLDSRMSWNGDLENISDVAYDVLLSILEQAGEGREDSNYIIFLIALISNTLLSQGWGTIDPVARTRLQRSEMALRWAIVFNDKSKQGEDILRLPYSQLYESMTARLRSIADDSDFAKRDQRTIEKLRQILSSNRVWRLRVRELDEDEAKIRELQVDMHVLREKLMVESTGRVNAEKLVRTIVMDTRIMDEGVMRYLSSRTYNYFLLSWNPYVSGTKSGLKDIVDSWIEQYEELLGYPVLLGSATRIGKIPDGYTFVEFTEWAVEKMSMIAEGEDIKPHMFLVRWAPSNYSARALSTIESLEWSSIKGLEEVFTTTDDRRARMTKFIEGSVISQLTVDDTLAAVRQSGKSLFEIWKDDVFQVRSRGLLSKENQQFVSDYERNLTVLINLMLEECSADNLFELTMHDYEYIVLDLVDDAFPPKTRGKTKDKATEIVTTLLNHLRMIAAISLSKGEWTPSSA